jgi:DNA-binding MarR family transcriptional regulator
VVTQFYDAALAPSGLKCTQFTLLVASRISGEETVKELAEIMVMDRTTLSRNLKPMVRDGLLEVLPGPDSRTRLVKITPEGERSLEAAYPLWRAAQQDVVEVLGEERYTALLGNLGQMVEVSAKNP